MAKAPKRTLTVVLVEDDPQEATVIKDVLDDPRYTVVHATTIKEGFKFFESLRPDLMVLDVNLPDGSGFDLCKKVRDHHLLASTPVIILSGQNELSDKAQGFGAGADQYLAKPVQIKELSFWIEALLNRINYKDAEGGVLRVDDFTLDPQTHTVRAGEKVVENLTNREFDLLYKLVQNKPKVLSKDFILRKLWKTVLRDNTIGGHIKNLRAKLGEAGNRIVTVHGVGYKFE